MLHLDYRDGRPIYAQIAAGIVEQIVTGVRQPGEKLPSVRELATELTINPNTIARSYRQLEMEGWIVTVPGKGCFVSGNLSTRDREQERWYAAFDEAAANLMALGITPERLSQRLLKGGK